MNTAKLLTVPRIIVGAMAASTATYFAVLLVLSQQWDGQNSVDQVIVSGLIAAAAFQVLAVPVLRRVVMGHVALSTPPLRMGLDATPVSESQLEDALSSAAQRYQTGTIVGAALAEAVAVFGFVAAFLSQDITWYVPAWVVSLVLLGVQFPRDAGLACLLGPAEQRAFLGQGR